MEHRGPASFALVTNKKDPNYGKIGRVGTGAHNCFDIHFEDGSVVNMSTWDLEPHYPE